MPLFLFLPVLVLVLNLLKKKEGNKTIEETLIGYNAATKEFYTDRSNAGNAKMNEKRLNEFVRTDRYDSTVHIQILLNKSSLEAFLIMVKK